MFICLYQCPRITSSSSSSEGDEEEADGEAGRELRGQQEELSSRKANVSPPSYNHQQVLKHFTFFGVKSLGNAEFVCVSKP